MRTSLLGARTTLNTVFLQFFSNSTTNMNSLYSFGLYDMSTVQVWIETLVVLKKNTFEDPDVSAKEVYAATMHRNIKKKIAT